MKLHSIYLIMALRNVRRNPRRSTFTVLAVAFGLFCLIVFQALKAGLHREMIAGAVSLDAGALQIHAAGHETNHTALRPLAGVNRVEGILSQAGIAHHAPRLKSPALILAGDQSSSVLLSGIIPRAEAGVTVIRQRLVVGDYLAAGRQVLLGRELADSLGAAPGGTVTIMARDSLGQPVVGKFVVGGLYLTGLASFDRTHVYLARQDLQSFLKSEPDAVTEIAVRLPQEKIAATAHELRRQLPADQYQIRTWDEIAPDVKQLIELNDATMLLLILIVFAIVALGITNTMTTVIFERFRELGILATIGTTPAGIIVMVILESLMLGGMAVLLGGMAGFSVCLFLARHGIDLTSLTSSNQYFAASHVLKAHLTSKDLSVAILITLLTAALAGIYPAWKASRLQPVDALSHT